MPDELTDYAKELITRCPQLINRFAEKINSMINNWHESEREEVLEPIEIHAPGTFTITEDVQDLICHVGYDAAQCGYEK